MPFRTYGAEEGLSNQAVTRIAQDGQGFLWVGTQGHLFRFDGRSFQPFGMREGLPSGSITALASDPGGGLWIGTFRGLGRMERGRVQTIPSPSAPIHQIRTRGGQVWVAGAAGLLAGARDRPFRSVPGWEGEARALWAPAGTEDLWAAGGERLRHYRADAGWRDQPLPGPRERILDLNGDARGLYVRTSTRLWALRSGVIQDLTPGSFSPPGEDAQMVLDALGRLWVPTHAGLWVLEQDRWTFLDPASGLPTPSPNTVLLDREGSLWVAGQGVHRLEGQGRWLAHGLREGLPHPSIWSIARDGAGTLWVATSGGLARSEGARWKEVPGTRGQRFQALSPRREGGLWACGPQGDLYMAGTRLAPPRTGLPAVPGLAILEDRRGRVWVGTRGAGLWCRSKGGSTFIRVPLPSGTNHERVAGLAEGSDGSLWVAAEGGLAHLQEERWTRYTDLHGLRHTHVEGVRVTRGGLLLVSYYEPLGFSRFQPGEGTLRLVGHEDTSTGLAADMVYFLGEDPAGRIWVGTGKGLDVLIGGRIQHFGRLDGLAGEDCNAHAFLAEPGDVVWVGTSTGLSRGEGRWDPSDQAPATVILKASLKGLPLALNTDTPQRVPAAVNDLQAQFATPSFLYATGLESRYRLLGQDEGWRVAVSNEIQAPRLSPGRYTLEIQSRIQRGPWGPAARLSFLIPPAWWQPWWVRTLASLLLAAGLGRIVLRHWRKLQQRTLELETLLNLADQLTRELEAANIALQQESTTDPLTGLRNRRYLDTTLRNDLAHVERAYRTFREQGLEGAPPNADLVFMIVDIDHFKHVNDCHGHLAGDAVLQQFADILRSATRGSDTIIRWGGEEFLVEARHSQRRDIPIMAERIRRSVENWAFQLPDGTTIRCTCSVGFAPFPLRMDHDLTWQEVVDLADHCLYRAKTSGRNRWVGHVTEVEIHGPSVPVDPA